MVPPRTAVIGKASKLSPLKTTGVCWQLREATLMFDEQQMDEGGCVNIAGYDEQNWLRRLEGSFSIYRGHAAMLEDSI